LICSLVSDALTHFYSAQSSVFGGELILDLIKSKRFWATVSGIAVVIANQFFPTLSTEAVISIVAVIAAWVMGDSMRATTKTAILLLCLLCIGSTTIAQTITPTKVNVTSGFTNPRIVGNYILHGESSKPVSESAILLTLDMASGQNVFDYYADAIPTLEEGALEALPDGSYLLVGAGRYRLVFYFENPAAVRRLTVELGPPAPPPEPPKPDVVVPPDAFENIGQRTAVWAKGLPKTQQVAALYVACAEEIVGSTKTINACIETMVKARSQLLTTDEQRLYQPLLDQLNADLKKRWPMAALTCANYFNAIAAGLVGAK
jgi:hypothetical protein